MKYKVADLVGVPLDAAVALAERDGGMRNLIGQWMRDDPLPDGKPKWSPSTRWENAARIIEGQGIAFTPVSVLDSDPPVVSCWLASCITGDHAMRGPTHLIAGMRAFVASKFGEEVDLP